MKELPETCAGFFTRYMKTSLGGSILGFKLAYELKKYNGHLRSKQSAVEDVRHSIIAKKNYLAHTSPASSKEAT